MPSCHLKALLHSRYPLKFPTLSVFLTSTFSILFMLSVCQFEGSALSVPLSQHSSVLWACPSRSSGCSWVSLFFSFLNTAARAPQLRPAQRTAPSQPTSQHQSIQPTAPPPQITILCGMLFSPWDLGAFRPSIVFGCSLRFHYASAGRFTISCRPSGDVVM